MPKTVQRITPFLWFNGNAEEAVTRYDEYGAQASGQPKGSVMTVAFELEGQAFAALNGGPAFKFTEAISFPRKRSARWRRCRR